MDAYDTVLEFWFGNATDDAAVAREQSSLWWKKSPDTDRIVGERFGTLVDLAAAGQLHEWGSTPPGLLARIIVCDQFPRNIYRDTPQAFAFDHHSRQWCRDGLEAGIDLELRPIERVFFYLPLEHSEELDDQQRSVDLYTRLADEVAKTLADTFSDYVDYAKRHRDIVERFGRFPHRNAILGRQSTPEELEFLSQPGSGF